VFPQKITMMIKTVLSSFAVTALTASLAAPAAAQKQTAYVKNPVTVEGFSADSDFVPSAAQLFGGMNVANELSDVTISFVNTANVPAKRIEFAVTSGKHTCVIVDKGTFSPGARITHTFLQSSELVGASSVTIRKVTFADGSTWES
jgi:ABC-type transport system involved in cytochrome bd biosynthesis fused ATPase/permease subunit